MSLTIDASFYQTAQAILEKLGATPTATNLNLLVAWSYCEKPHYSGSSWQWNNPLNTTEPGFGATTSVNSAGVKQYPTKSEGIAATVATLSNGRYSNLVTALKNSNSSLFFAQTGEMKTWGTQLSCIQSTFGSLSHPPSSYLASSSSKNGTTRNSVPGVFLSSSSGSGSTLSPRILWIWIGGVTVAAIGTIEAVQHPKAIREWSKSVRKRVTLNKRR